MKCLNAEIIINKEQVKQQGEPLYENGKRVGYQFTLSKKYFRETCYCIVQSFDCRESNLSDLALKIDDNNEICLLNSTHIAFNMLKELDELKIITFTY